MDFSIVTTLHNSVYIPSILLLLTGIIVHAEHLQNSIDSMIDFFMR